MARPQVQTKGVKEQSEVVWVTPSAVLFYPNLLHLRPRPN